MNQNGSASHILLTGGTGFFGRALLRYWAVQPDEGRPQQVVVLSRSPERLLRECPEFAALHWLRMHRGDVMDPETFPSDEGFSHLLHAAADSTLGPQLSPVQRFDQIVTGTRNLLDFAVSHRIARVLLISSGAVYGRQPADLARIPETYTGSPDPLDVHQAYGMAKRCAEQLCMLYADAFGIETVVARCFAFVGQDLPLDVHFAIGNFLRDALAGREIVVSGDGTPVRSYMDQRDLARWLDILMHRGQSGEAYNVGSDQAITIREVANLVRDLLAPHQSVHIQSDASLQGMRNQYVPSIDKARTALDLRLRYPLIEAIREAARCARSNEGIS
jgi:dTDP-glucose 4,6-dehydratase